MDRIDGRPVYSATDLVAYLACEHLTQLERAALAGLVKRPIRDDPELDIIRQAAGSSTKHASWPTSAPPVAIRSRSSSTDRPRTGARSCGQPPRRDDRGDGRRRGRDLPGDVLRRHVPRPRRLPAPRGRRRSGLALGAVSLRGRRHEARASRQGERRAPDLLIRRPAGADPGRATGMAPRRARAAAPGPSSGCASTTTWPTTGALATGSWRPWPTRRRPPTRRPARTPTRSSTATSAAGLPSAPRADAQDDHLSLVAGITARQRRALTERGIPTLEALGDLTLPMQPAARWNERGRPVPSPRTGADPAPGPSRAVAPIRAPPARRPAPRSRPERGLGIPAAAIGRRPVLRHRGRPVRVRRRARLPVRRPRDRRGVHRDLVEATTPASSRSRASSVPSSADRLHHGAARARSDAPRLPLRAIRADGAEAADGSLRDARGRGRPAAARGRDGRPAAGGPPVAAGIGRELFDQEDGAVLRLRSARSTCATRARASSRSSNGWSWARASVPHRPISSGSSATTATTWSATASSGTGWRVGARNWRA